MNIMPSEVMPFVTNVVFRQKLFLSPDKKVAFDLFMNSRVIHKHNVRDITNKIYDFISKPTD